MTMEYNQMQLLKREMFAMRNGIVADTLRKAGSSFKIIFGLNLPQISEIASHFPKDRDFAEQVYSNSTTRESMLIAPMLMPFDQFTSDDAERWIAVAPEREVIDVTCLKLLRHLPFALNLAQALVSEQDPKLLYAGMRLMCNLAPQYPELVVEVGKSHPDHPLAQILLSYE